MRINNIKINNFGKLHEKEIKFANNINVIYGKNESGKSTLLKLITSMFYGLSKNKNGKEITDFEKYTPWEGESFSAKLKYELDNKKQYEIYREFRKKEPKIFNEELEEISGQFNIDKTKGNQFFYNQTKIDEELFLSTIVSEQEELKLNQKSQEILLQKLSNIVSTGEYNTSFQKILNKLNKKQLEEIGTKRSQDRPINIIENKLKQLKKEKEDIEEYQKQKYEIEQEIIYAKKQLEGKKQLLELQQQTKELYNKNQLEKERIKINEKQIEKCKQNVEELKEKLEPIQLEQIKLEKTKLKSKVSTIIIILAVILSILSIVLLKNIVLKFIPLIFTIVYTFVNYITQRNKTMCITKKKKETQLQKDKIKAQIEILEHEILEYKQQISIIENTIRNRIEIEKQILKEKVDKPQEIDEIFKVQEIEQLEKTIINLQNIINETKLEIHKLELENQKISEKIENIIEIEEQTSNLQEQYEELLEYNETIEIAKQELEKAYEEMKQNITPRFTNKLSEIINKISNGKYKTVNFNEEKGITVELKNGNYVTANMLSIGTMDQLYLALRLSTIEEISEETMPILLDETFAYFDETRLENILKYLNEKFNNRQTIIFTCTNREIQTLEKNKIEYNLVNM